MCGVYKFRLISNTYFVHQHAYDDTRNNVFMGLLDNISNKSYFSKKWLSCFCVLWLWIKFSNDLVKLQEMLSSFWLENTINLYKLTWEKKWICLHYRSLCPRTLSSCSVKYVLHLIFKFCGYLHTHLTYFLLKLFIGILYFLWSLWIWHFKIILPS